MGFTRSMDGESVLGVLWSGEESKRKSVLAHAAIANTDHRSHWYGALIHQYSSTTGTAGTTSASSGTWKIVVNTSTAGWYSPDSLHYAQSGGAYVEPSYYEDLAMDGLATFNEFFNASYLFDLENDPYERVDLKDVYPETFNSLVASFFEDVQDAVDAQYYCGCNCNSEGCHDLFEWFYENDCFIVPWNTTTVVPTTPTGSDDGDDAGETTTTTDADDAVAVRSGAKNV